MHRKITPIQGIESPAPQIDRGDDSRKETANSTDSRTYELEVVRSNDTNGVTTSRHSFGTVEILMMRLRRVLQLPNLISFTVTPHGR